MIAHEVQFVGKKNSVPRVGGGDPGGEDTLISRRRCSPRRRG